MKGRNLASIGETYAGPEHIGHSYTGPDFSRPALRQLPRSWTLEETRANARTPWYRHWGLWAQVAVWLVVLIACVQTVMAVLP